MPVHLDDRHERLAAQLDGPLPRLRIDHMLAFAWKFLLPMSFAAFLSAACWHYAGRGPLAWLLSLAIVGIPYLVLGTAFSNRFALSRRTYQFSE